MDGGQIEDEDDPCQVVCKDDETIEIEWNQNGIILVAMFLRNCSSCSTISIVGIYDKISFSICILENTSI